MLIHQESVIAAAPRAVYEVLTDGQKFAAATGMPAQLSDRAGEAFSLFGGRGPRWRLRGLPRSLGTGARDAGRDVPGY